MNRGVRECLSNSERKLGPGARLEDYELIEKIASGGMAEVFLARSTIIGDDHDFVVVKRLHPHLVAQQEWLNMLVDEATIGAWLCHDDIAAVHRIVDCDGVVFLVMEYVDGIDLLRVFRKTMRRGIPFPLSHAVRVIGTAARALDYVHNLRDDQGRPMHIVHRDISMSNIMVGFDGHAKLIDFGVAKAEQRITQTEGGVLKGKARYMSPEQILGKPIDRRSDIFSLGTVLYELTTGSALFRGRDHIETMRRVVRAPIRPPSTFCAGYPVELEAIVMRALSRDPSRRQRTAGELRQELADFASAARLRASATDLEAFMNVMYPDTPRRKRAKPVDPIGVDQLLQHHRRAQTSPSDWCPDTNEVSAFLDAALGGFCATAVA